MNTTKFTTIVCAGTVAGSLLLHEGESLMRLDEPMRHIDVEMKLPTHAGKFDIITEVRSRPININVFDKVAVTDSAELSSPLLINSFDSVSLADSSELPIIG